MKRSLFWLSALIQAIYLLNNLSQLIYVFIAIGSSGHWFITSDTLVMVIFNAIEIAVFYLFYLVLFPKFLYKRRIKTFVAYALLVIILATIPGTVIGLRSVSALFHFQQVYSIGSNFIITGLIACMMRGFINWVAEIGYKQQLEKKNLETNMALLKAQINPHFLFNTLNNIDVLIEKEPVKASAYLKKLSDILRFTLYESPSETIPLDKEAGYINQYIELQRIRTNNSDFVSFNIKGDTGNMQIAPMLFIPFIENAFKHCTNKKLNKAIAISIQATENVVTFNCSNAYDADGIAVHEKSGLGLGLIRSRLELLYPDKYQLDIDKTADRFTVNLSVNLI